VWCLPEIEGSILASPPTRARHTLTPLLSMIMIEIVKRMLRQSDRELVVECRQCGSKVDPDAESCPVCESTEIARYDISR
jgi:predicted Zn-ribbon and HTH transcriptional regulator